MNVVRSFVASWPMERVNAALADQDAFERDAQIGDCVLRSSANELMKQLNVGTSITTWMRDIAFECWRRKALSK